MRKMASVEEDFLINTNKDIFFEEFSHKLEKLRSLDEMLIEASYWEELFNKRENPADASFMDSGAWRMILKRLGKTIYEYAPSGINLQFLQNLFIPMNKLPPPQISGFRGLFEVVPEFHPLPYDVEYWNRYRIIADYSDYFALTNDHKSIKLDEHKSELATNLFYLSITLTHISIYTDEPWNDNFLILRVPYPHGDKSRYNPFLIETVRGLVLIATFEDKDIFMDDIFLVDIPNKSLKLIGTIGPVTEDNPVRYTSNMYILNGISYSYDGRRKEVKNLNMHRTSLLGVNFTGEYVYDSIRKKLLYKPENPGFLFNSFDSLYFGESEIYDLCTGRELFSIRDLVEKGGKISGITRKDDATGYFVWVDKDALKEEWKEYFQNIGL